MKSVHALRLATVGEKLLGVTDTLSKPVPEDVLEAADALLLDGQFILAIKLFKERTRCGLHDALEWITHRTEALMELHPRFRAEETARKERETSPSSWRTQGLENLSQLARPPCAVEAIWDGDSTGWLLTLEAILPGASREHPRFTSVRLVTMRGESGDMRFIQGSVPSWSGKEIAEELGQIAHERWGIPFYFPSPDNPIDDAPRWWDSQLEPGTP
ncbi:hypothetical protein HK404_05675 [Myxococcus xanthus]|nr:hypothetical protein [Myxococcus xanthus]QPM83329.1 hypothetical protein I5Q59_16775 [Myxococcus xanthus]QVW71896.1 hypothetical protein JTM82_22120 [Myxococcus xanthus DZ2]UEO08623.1 hypothetical protein K1515_20675 [Myxococcus xanthus DZ2]